MVDKSQDVIDCLSETLTKLDIDNAKLYCADILQTLNISEGPFDIIFLDPPFRQNLIPPTCQFLLINQLIAKNALIYLEAEKELRPLPIPSTWKTLRKKTAGQLSYYLFIVN